MRNRRFHILGIASGALFFAHASTASAGEYGFSSYGLGSSAFSAGVTPPPGTYVTFVSGFYQAKIGGEIPFGGVTLNAGAKLEFFQSANKSCSAAIWVFPSPCPSDTSI